jgi:hypothetical protein
MQKRRNILQRIIDDYHITMFVGVMFVLSGLMAAARDVIEVYTGFKVDLFHSMIFLGIFQCCMAIVFIVLGARNIEAGEREATGGNPAEADTDLLGRVAALEARLVKVEQNTGDYRS